MSVNYVEGDLFDPAFGFDAIGHGVNCKGKMGSGIAVEFRKRWPLMYRNYYWLCRSDTGFFLPGQVYPWKAEDGLTIYNIASQYLPGPDAKQEYLEVGLQYVHFHMLQKGLTNLGLPRIGAGIGGLTFQTVCDTVEFVFGKSDLNVTIVSLKE